MNRTPFHFVVMLLMSCVIGCSRNPQARSDKLVRSGDHYFGQGRYEEASIEYRNALQADPKSAVAHYSLAITDTKLGDWTGAVKELERTVELQPSNVQARLDLGNIILAGKDFERAGQIAFALLQQYPSNAEAHSLMANVSEAQGRHDEAATEIGTAISINPGNAGFYLTRGGFESNAERLEAAEKSYQKAIEIDPKYFNAIAALGGLYEHQERWTEAEKMFQRYIELQPQSAAARLELAKLHLAQGHKEAAEAVLVQAQKDLPNDPSAYRLLPEFYQSTGQTDKALIHFEALYKQHPSDLKTANEYARLLLHANQLDKAKGINERVLAANRRDGDALTLKAEILSRQGNTEAAISILRTVVGDEPSNAVAHYTLGSVLNDSGDQNGAENEWRQAAQLQPDMVQVQRVLARVSVAKHDMNLLRQSSEGLLANDPQSPDGYIYRALAETNDHQDDKAQTDLKEAIKLAPQNPLGFAELADWQVAHRQYGEAEKLDEHALQLDPTYSAALRGLIAIYKKRGTESAKILARIQEQIAKAPGNSDLYLLLGAIQEETRDFSGAEVSAQKAVNLDPNNDNAFEMLGRIEAKRGATEKALLTSYEWIKRNPKYAHAYVLAGSLEESKGNYKAAQDLYNNAHEIHPHDADAQNNLAYSLLENGGDTDVALSLAQAAHIGAPNVPTIEDTLAWAYYRKGVYKTAIPLLQDAIKAEPETAMYQYHIGMVYEQLKDLPQAKLHLRKALVIEPNSMQADLVRKELQHLGS
jgi:tetratricopeptide (TPR) repeat protein